MECASACACACACVDVGVCVCKDSMRISAQIIINPLYKVQPGIIAWNKQKVFISFLQFIEFQQTRIGSSN